MLTIAEVTFKHKNLKAEKFWKATRENDTAGVTAGEDRDRVSGGCLRLYALGAG